MFSLTDVLPFIFPSIYVSIHVSFHPCIFPPTHLSINPSILSYLPSFLQCTVLYVSIYLYINLYGSLIFGFQYSQVYHGDIKTENVMVTSWTSVLLTDLASFKPTYLQQDNPADFSYFFDTSRRRTCYLAPERFQDIRQNEVSSSTSVAGSTVASDQQSTATGEGTGTLDLGLMKDHVSELTSAMDVFSTG